MGQFSWITDDTDRQIGSMEENTITVYMHDDKGNVWKEDEYEGYGEFGGKDYYELVAEMNGYNKDNFMKFYEKEGNAPDDLGLDFGPKELRYVGIDMEGAYDKGNREYKFPRLVQREMREGELDHHKFDTPPERDPNQGWYQPEDCSYCDGTGEQEYYDDETDRYEWGECEECSGSGDWYAKGGLTKSKWKKASVKDKKKALKSFSSKYVDYEWDALPDNVKEMVITGKITDYYGTGYGSHNVQGWDEIEDERDIVGMEYAKGGELNDKEVVKGLLLYFDETTLDLIKLYKKLGKEKYNEFEESLKKAYNNSANKKIVKGLLLYFDETNLNLMKLYKKLGKEKYRKFEDALEKAYSSYAKGGKTTDKEYVLERYYVDVHKDSYEEGEGNEVQSWDSSDFQENNETFSSKSALIDFIKEVIERDTYDKVKEKYLDIDSEIDEDEGSTRISYAVLCKYIDLDRGYDHYEVADKKSIELWKKGKKDLFSVSFAFSVKTYEKRNFAEFAKGGKTTQIPTENEAQYIMYRKLKELNISIGGWEKVIKEAFKSEEGEGTVRETISIEPSETGPMAPMFKSIEQKVLLFVGRDEKGVVMIIGLDYSYTHPSGGTNGYRITYRWMDGKGWDNY